MPWSQKQSAKLHIIKSHHYNDSFFQFLTINNWICFNWWSYKSSKQSEFICFYTIKVSLFVRCKIKLRLLLTLLFSTVALIIIVFRFYTRCDGAVYQPARVFKDIKDITQYLCSIFVCNYKNGHKVCLYIDVHVNKMSACVLWY